MKPFEDLIDKVAFQERLPAAVGQALVDNENVKRDPNLVLRESWGGGSHGLTMITLRTARSLGFRGASGDLLVPETNLRYGFRYLRQMFDQVGKGDWSMAAAAYNAGPDLSPFPTEYVARFAGHLAQWQKVKGRAAPFVGPTMPPTQQAGFGGWTLLILLGAAIPFLLSLFKGRGRR